MSIFAQITLVHLSCVMWTDRQKDGWLEGRHCQNNGYVFQLFFQHAYTCLYLFQEESVLVMWSVYDQIQVGVYLYCQYMVRS